jgi:hypothetical protein
MKKEKFQKRAKKLKSIIIFAYLGLLFLPRVKLKINLRSSLTKEKKKKRKRVCTIF